MWIPANTINNRLPRFHDPVLGFLVGFLGLIFLAKFSVSFIVFASFFLVLLSVVTLMLIVPWPSVADISVVIFYLFFLILAPVSQIYNRGEITFITTIPYDDVLVVTTNFVNMVFLAAYLLGKFLMMKMVGRPSGLASNDFLECSTFLSLPVIFIISLCIFIILLPIALGAYNQLEGFSALGTQSDSSIWNLVTRKFLMVMPVVFLIASISYRGPFAIKVPLVLIAGLLVLFFKNPIVEHRNGFGIVYLMIALIALHPILKRKGTIFLFFIAIFALAFPLGQALAPHRFIEDQFNLFDMFIATYNTINFDAWANIAACVIYVRDFDFTYGYQVLSSVLFWVPRDFWPEKGVATGQLVGEYMVSHHSHWMTNISFPIMAEGYIDFGWPGVMLFGILFGSISMIIDQAFTSPTVRIRLSAVFISASFIFLLRGPLLSSFAYISAGAFAIYIGCFLSERRKLYRRWRDVRRAV